MKPDFYNQTYIGNFLNGISQLGNMLSGSRADISISARCGYFSSIKKDKRYSKLEKFIDWTFYPIEGEGHCLKAHLKDPNEDYEFDKGDKLGLWIIKGIVYTVCPILALLFWGWHGIRSGVQKLK